MSEAAFLLWSQVLLIFSVATYAVRDPLRDDLRETEQRFGSLNGWRAWIFGRAFLAALLVAYLSADILLSEVVVVAAAGLPLLRSRIPPQRSAELEILAVLFVAAVTAGIVHYVRLPLANAPIHLPLSRSLQA